MNIKDLLKKGSKPGAYKGEYYVCCPYCLERVGKQDIKYKMGVSVNKNIAHCFRCGVVLKFDKESEGEDFGLDFKSSNLEDLKSSLEDNPIEKNKQETEVLDLGIISKEITEDDTPFAYDYLIQRGITKSEINELDIRCGKMCTIGGKVIRKWEGRILFPFIEDDEVKYIVGRDYIGQDPRYLNSKGDKSVILYRVGELDDRVFILCEGIISAISARRYTGINSACTLGKYPSDIQLTKLRKICDKVYFSYDADVNNDVKMHVVSNLVKYDFEVFVVDIPLTKEQLHNGSVKVYKDPDDYKEKYLDFFNKAKKFA